jgi:hypothetical protein
MPPLSPELLKQIETEADKYNEGSTFAAGRFGYIARATAYAHYKEEAERYRRALEALERYTVCPSGPVLAGVRKIVTEGLGINDVKNPVAKFIPDVHPDLGMCKECNNKPAVTDYNGCQHYVCLACDESLNREFDEEYR